VPIRDSTCSSPPALELYDGSVRVCDWPATAECAQAVLGCDPDLEDRAAFGAGGSPGGATTCCEAA
jgi:hypothetical protein